MICATGSMDHLAKLWDLERGEEIATLKGHNAEIVSLHFNSDGDKVLTASFDHTARIWDIRTGKCIHSLEAHTAELSSS